MRLVVKIYPPTPFSFWSIFIYMENNIRHAIITRMAFTDPDTLNHYLEVCKNTLIPSLRSQTKKNFSLYIIGVLQTKHIIYEFFKKEGIEIAGYMLLVPMKITILASKFDIQTRIDCDDWMHPTAVEKIQKLYIENIDVHDSFLISSRPDKMSYDEFLRLEKPRVKMSAFPSNFLSLCKKQNSCFWVYEGAHQDYIEIIPTVLYLGDGMSKWIIHGKNLSLSPLSERKNKKHLT